MIEKIKKAVYNIMYVGMLLLINTNAAYAQATTSTATDSPELDKWLQLIIDGLTVVIGIAFVLSFMYAGFQYMTARDNANQVSEAKNRIATLVMAFIVFVFGYAALQWLVPGGIFN